MCERYQYVLMQWVGGDYASRPILHLGRGHRGGYRHRRVRAGFQGLGFDGVGVSCDGETVRERVIRDGMLICMCEGINDGTRGGLEAGV